MESTSEAFTRRILLLRKQRDEEQNFDFTTFEWHWGIITK